MTPTTRHARCQRRTWTDGTLHAFVGSSADERPLAAFASDARLDRLLLELGAGFGRRHWWPAEQPFEVLVGAVLTQNTAWGNVELALARLRAADALDPERILALATGDPDAEPAGLEALLRPSGTFRGKAKKLRALCRWYLDVGGLATLESAPLEPLRRDLLAVHGVGPETADSILCYAGGRRTAIVDTYTRRVLERHELLPGAGRLAYEAVRAWLDERLLPDQLVFEEFHALCVAAGYRNCKPKPACEGCPATTPAKLS